MSILPMPISTGLTRWTFASSITEDKILVRFRKRAHNPLLIAAGFHETDIRVPWLGGKRLQLIFG